jgi:branched-chain amino acid transport system substrate-binding protein
MSHHRTTHSRRHWLLTTGALLLGTISGCGGKASDPNTIKIVSSLPRTGSAQAQTQSIVNGITLALEEVNYQVGNFKIVYGATEDLDDATAARGDWTAEREKTNANQAVRDPDVMVYIGPYNSGAAMESMPILNKGPLLQISPANTAVGLTKPSGKPGEPEIFFPTGKRTYCRVVGTDDVQGPLAAVWAKKLGIKTVYVLDDKGTYGNGVAKEFKAKCDQLGLEVIAHEGIDVQATDFKSLLTKIGSNKPDLIYFGGTTQTKGAHLAKELAAANLSCKLMVPEGCLEGAFIKTALAENVNDRVYLTFPGPRFDESPAGKAFTENYVKKFNVEPEPFAIYGYEAGKVAIAAIKQAGKKDRQAIIDAAFNLKDFEGALGKWSFDKNGDVNIQGITGYTIKDGKFVISDFIPKE